MRPVIGGGSRVWFSWAVVVICAMSCRLQVFVVFVRQSWRLLSFLDSWVCVSKWASCEVTLGRRGGETDVGCRWAMCQGCGRRGWRGGCWLKKKRHKDVTLASRSTVKSTNLWDLVWPYFKQVLLETHHPNITVNSSHVFDLKNNQMYA